MAEQTDGFPADLRYSTEHEWLRVEDGQARVGITHYAQERLGDVVYVDLPQPGTRVTFMEKMAEIESVKVVSEVYSPASGEVVEVNTALAESPELVNEDPYGRGWLLVVRLDSQEEVDKLLNAEAYAERVRAEIEEQAP